MSFFESYFSNVSKGSKAASAADPTGGAITQTIGAVFGALANQPHKLEEESFVDSLSNLSASAKLSQLLTHLNDFLNVSNRVTQSGEFKNGSAHALALYYLTTPDKDSLSSDEKAKFNSLGKQYGLSDQYMFSGVSSSGLFDFNIFHSTNDNIDTSLIPTTTNSSGYNAGSYSTSNDAGLTLKPQSLTSSKNVNYILIAFGVLLAIFFGKKLFKI